MSRKDKPMKNLTTLIVCVSLVAAFAGCNRTDSADQEVFRDDQIGITLTSLNYGHGGRIVNFGKSTLMIEAWSNDGKGEVKDWYFKVMPLDTFGHYKELRGKTIRIFDVSDNPDPKSFQEPIMEIVVPMELTGKTIKGPRPPATTQPKIDKNDTTSIYDEIIESCEAVVKERESIIKSQKEDLKKHNIKIAKTTDEETLKILKNGRNLKVNLLEAAEEALVNEKEDIELLKEVKVLEKSLKAMRMPRRTIKSLEQIVEEIDKVTERSVSLQ